MKSTKLSASPTEDLEAWNVVLLKTNLSFPPLLPELSGIENGGERKMDLNSKKCNIFDGNWIYNPLQRPIYDPSFVFLSEQWEWFNGMELLERMRGKQIVLVGNSLNRNRWEYLAFSFHHLERM
ncbi:hypothetical protein AMTR_s00021p00119940 [Amborella trichopoda]|uniref:Trichome birefringence-like C-terminal domain-containing protein n=1 Tax=Amborella trichopoda TaxID=13333 RepID=W1PZR7_AMBTC|nr:hypothetical protein AMTR_s00021p00119940 [Amborella trichopoda]